VAATGTTSTSVSLSWTASTDNVGVTGYDVYRGTVLAGSTAGTTFTDTGLSSSTAYTYTVKAFDAAGNLSQASTPVTVTTQGTGANAGCTAAYAVTNQWNNGFTATVTVTNSGTAATGSWQVGWTWPGTQQITNSWNATEAHSGQNETFTAESFNAVIAPGATTSFGFQASYSGTNPAPTPVCTAS
jgi:chitodextrinase